MTVFYNTFFPISFIHHEFKEDIIPRLLHRQKIMLSKNETRKKKGKKPIDPRSFLIMDDINSYDSSMEHFAMLECVCFISQGHPLSGSLSCSII